MEGSGCCRPGLGYGLYNVSDVICWWRSASANCTIRVESQEPLLLLLVGHDVDECGCPLSAVGVLELFEQDLDGLSIGGVHGDEVDAFGILWGDVSVTSALKTHRATHLDLGRCIADVELVGHDCCAVGIDLEAVNYGGMDGIELRASVYIHIHTATCRSDTDARSMRA